MSAITTGTGLGLFNTSWNLIGTAGDPTVGRLMMTEAQHQATRTYGFRGALTVNQEAGMSFRDVLARDIRDVRGIAGSQHNDGLRGLTDYYRNNFPELMLK